MRGARFLHVVCVAGKTLWVRCKVCARVLVARGVCACCGKCCCACSVRRVCNKERKGALSQAAYAIKKREPLRE